MNYSENYGFALPDDGDFYDIAPVSDNFDAIDGILTEQDANLTEINSKIGTPGDSGSETLFGLLGNSGGFIRSFQTVDLNSTAYQGKASKNINPVDPSKCIVLMQRLQDSTHHSAKVLDTLTATDISYISESTVNGELYLRFQIIELF